ncbi:MAG: hypothetical protein JW929_04265 [Anaerolineales bacterium]|nr:hypothetical protein [Anaerolineales bacterium]
MKPKHPVRDQVLPVLLVVFFLSFLLIAVWSPGSWRGADTWGHLYRAEYLAGEMRTQGPAAYFRAAWMPNWYMGDPFLTYYPPLTTLVLAPLVFLFGDSATALRILISAFFLGFSALTFVYLSRAFNRWAALLGTVLAACAPYQLRTIYYEGNLPRMLSLLALPAIAILTDRLLVERVRRVPVMILLGICWAWSILAHPQQALIFALGLGMYLLLRLILDPEVPVYHLAHWTAAVLLGALWSAPWLLPAYSHAELANIPYLPLEKIPLFSAHLAGFLPFLDAAKGYILFGFGALLIGLLAMSVRPDPRRSAWYLAGWIAIAFSFGPKGVFFSLLPLQNQLLPERFVNFAAFAIPLAAAGLLPLGRSLRWIRGPLLVILVAAELLPAARLLPGVPYPQEQAVLEAAADPGGGRTALLTYPEPNSLEVYFSGRTSDLINGWALENTPHHVELRRVLSAPEWGPEYLTALFSKWDVRTAVISGGGEADPARASVAAMGFVRITTLGRYDVWRSPAPSARVRVIPEQSMLVVGEGASPFLAAFPFAEEASPAEFAAGQSLRLGEYPVIALYRFAASATEVKTFEDDIRNYLDAGGTVLVDLSGMEDLFGRTLDIFGVHAFRLSFTGRIPLRWADESSGLPASLSLTGLDEGGWSGAVYEELDSVLAWTDWEGASFPVLGCKNVGSGKVWFVGVNLLYYSQLSGMDSLRAYIRSTVLHGSAVSTDLEWQAVQVAGYSESSAGISFAYDAADTASALVSYTYSPRWRATIDGIEVPLGVRDHLIRLTLPAGTHFVEIRYDPFGTVWPGLGWAACALGIAGAAAFWGFEFLRRNRVPAKHDFLEVFQKPDSPDGGTYAPCAHCGFRLAESRPPTPITYPFHASHCPICDSRMDDEGFVPGKDLSREDKAHALHRWLRANRYDPRTIHTKWGFSVEEFFQR